jgi:hypothetical protein
VAVATYAAAHLFAVRREVPVPEVRVDSRGAAAGFQSEAMFAPQGWTLPPPWDPIAGNYRTGDGWIRLHTNYASHRAAVERVLAAFDRDSVAAAVQIQRGVDLESAIVAAGGAAAVMHTRREWLDSEPGAATAQAPSFGVTRRPVSSATRWASNPPELPFSGVRVLDLTRVIAGPVCTKFLAAYGADILRIDPPGFEEVPALLPETTLGKRVAALDLSTSADRGSFEELLATADVLVCGLRADALSGLGYDEGTLTALNPGMIVASLDAYGWVGPWRTRRGFDSLVQLSSGIAASGAGSGTLANAPEPLPAQALDHGTGWLLAASIAQALTLRLTEATTTAVTASLIGTSNLLYALTELAGAGYPDPGTADEVALESTTTAWGPAQRVPLPGHIDGLTPHFVHEAGPLGRHPATWGQ